MVKDSKQNSYSWKYSPLFFTNTVFGPILGGFLAGVVMVACFPDDDVPQEEGVL